MSVLPVFDEATEIQIKTMSFRETSLNCVFSGYCRRPEIQAIYDACPSCSAAWQKQDAMNAISLYRVESFLTEDEYRRQRDVSQSIPGVSAGSCDCAKRVLALTDGIPFPG